MIVFGIIIAIPSGNVKKKYENPIPIMIKAKIRNNIATIISATEFINDRNVSYAPIKP